MPELDSIRGLAILAVFFYHGFFWGTDSRHFTSPERLFVLAMWCGRMGVNLFFVLSGFLITGILVESRNRKNYYQHFYARRALRILPAYYAILAFLLLTHIAPWRFVALSSVYLANLTPLFGIRMAYQVLWSLAVEEHFYLIWPAFVRNLSLSRLLTCSAAIVVLSPFCRLANYGLIYRHGFVDYVFTEYTWNASDGLACGALLAIVLRQFTLERRQLLRMAVMCILIGAIMWVCCIPFGIWTTQRPAGAMFQTTAWNISFVGLLIAFLLFGTSQWRTLAANRSLRFFGNISYGLYLVHILLFGAYDDLVKRFFPRLAGTGEFQTLCLRFLVASAASVAVAYASRRWFENPFLRLKEKRSLAFKC